MPQELISFFNAAQADDFIVIGIFAAIWMMLMFYIFQFLLRLALHKIPPAKNTTLPFSVIMIERNEEENLLKNLPGWLSIGYPNYEMLVVDDFSEDNSLTTLGVLRLNHPRLRLTGLNQDIRYSQKISRNIALKAASYDHVVFIHPSMEMPGHFWLPGMASAFAGNKKIVIGYINLTPSKGSLHKLYRMELFYQQIESMAYCLNGMPFVVTEENVAFTKQLYFDMNGFAGKIRNEFLNMELIYNEIIRRKETAVLPDATIALRLESKPGKQEFRELLLKSFRIQRKLGLFKRLVLKFFSLLRLLFIPAAIICLVIYPVLWPIVAGMISIFALSAFFIIRVLLKRLDEPQIFLSSLIYGMIRPYYQLVQRWMHFRK